MSALYLPVFSVIVLGLEPVSPAKEPLDGLVVEVQSSAGNSNGGAGGASGGSETRSPATPVPPTAEEDPAPSAGAYGAGSRSDAGEETIVVPDQPEPDAQGRIPEDQTPLGKFTTATEVRPILSMTHGNWVGLRDWEGEELLYFTHLMAWRCGLWDIHYGINGAEPDTKVVMEPCYEDTSSPAAMIDIETFPVYYAFEDGEIETITIVITYDDGQTERAEFARSQILMP